MIKLKMDENVIKNKLKNDKKVMKKITWMIIMRLWDWMNSIARNFSKEHPMYWATAWDFKKGFVPRHIQQSRL
jgi:hypothetical protein